MSLLAVNEKWAVYSSDVPTVKIDSFKTVDSLLEVETYAQLIDFLINFTCNNTFLFECFTTKLCDIDKLDRESHFSRDMPALKGNCMGALDYYQDVEYLDELYISDNANKKVYWISIYELLCFKEFMFKIFTLAGVALGSKTCPDIFRTLDGSIEFESDIFGDFNNTLPYKINNVGIKIEDAGFGLNDIIGKHIIEYFDDVVNYKSNLMKKFSRKYSNGFKYYDYESEDVILSVQRYKHSNTPEKTRESLFGIWYPDSLTRDQAIRFLSGKIIELILNWGHGYAFYDSDFNNPLSYQQDEAIAYIYDPSFGFKQYDSEKITWWADILYDEIFEIVIDKKVSICPICGKPFLIKSRRGRKVKSVCSDSCKTKASIQRRELCLKYASAGVPIEEAISLIGEEYESSIKRWYTESNILNQSLNHE